MTVLILARDLDPHADRVVEALGERGVPVFRTDLAAFPQSLSLDARLGPDGWDGVLDTGHRQVRLGEIRSVWYRHPSHFVLPEGMSVPERRHAAAEARCGLAGVLSSLDVVWVNCPARESDALKPRQLQVARRCGLGVPEALVTNRPDAVRDFARQVGGVLAGKTLAAALLVESGRLQMAYTRRIEPADLADLAGVDTTLHLFEPFLPKAWEARVTVVGDRVFAVGIHAGSGPARVDWRADYDSLDYTVVTPPESVTTGIHAFMKTLGLSFGAFDFAVTPDKEWIRFECNPCGAYGWLEENLGLPITPALADLLATGATL
ncbi:MAG TPA: ATP-grasp ribosomal peptide maturase [Pseudonocardiaceae bacterium]|jgi:ATP-grasp ribosomal peptide maturase|nr:ATP-grasp ribosomal peptide maturase [Pseudonocardiaceae bacterium]